MRALAAAVVVASFIISSIAWGPPLALITKQPGAPSAPFNLNIIGSGNETGGVSSSSGSGGGSWHSASSSSSSGEPGASQNPTIPNPFAGLSEAIGNALSPGVSPEKAEAPKRGIALAFAVIAPVAIALAYYAIYSRGKGGVSRVRLRRKAVSGVRGQAVAEDGNIFVRVVRLLSLRVSEAIRSDPDILTHREVMKHAIELLGLGERVTYAVMGYEKLRFASREPSEEELRAAEEVLRVASR